MMTYIIIGVTVVLSIYAFSNRVLWQNWLMIPYRIRRNGEYHRFITSGFIHGDYMHLFFNMFSMFFFGKTVESYFVGQFGANGQYLFLGFYVLAIILADVPVFLKRQNQSQYSALGASGGVSAVVFAAIALQPNMKMLIPPFPVFIPGFIYGAFYLFYTAYMARKGNDNIEHDAHLYGALIGVLAIFLFFEGTFQNFIEIMANFRLF
jgi:membrane associated rhomboid family serine protease